MKIRSKSKTRRFLLLFGLGMMAAGMNAQYLKSGQIEVGNTGAKFRISDWNTEGGVGKYTDDDNFFISRVPLKERFSRPVQQANPDLVAGENAKNLCWWAPIGELTKKWGPLPRWNFDGDNFNMWQYININGDW